MGVNFDALVLKTNQDVFGVTAVVTPVKSAPNVAPFAVRGIFNLAGADFEDEDGSVMRMDNYTFDVRASELPIPVARGDRVSNIAEAFLLGLSFTIEDTGDDGFGAQKWVLKALDIRAAGA